MLSLKSRGAGHPVDLKFEVRKGLRPPVPPYTFAQARCTDTSRSNRAPYINLCVLSEFGPYKHRSHKKSILQSKHRTWGFSILIEVFHYTPHSAAPPPLGTNSYMVARPVRRPLTCDFNPRQDNEETAIGRPCCLAYLSTLYIVSSSFASGISRSLHRGR